MGETKEYQLCPECESKVNADHPEFHGDGNMTRNIWCTHCDWTADEIWTIVETEEL